MTADWAEQDIRHFLAEDAVGWIGPDGRLVPTLLHGHLDAFRNAPELRALLPASVDWAGNDRQVMDAVYGAGWGRIGTYGAEPLRLMELECFIEHLPSLRKRAEALAEVVSRQLTVSPVFTREDRLPRPELPRKGRRRGGTPLEGVARGDAVGWLSPQGGLALCNPLDPLSFLRSGQPGLESLARWLREADELYERWQSNQFAEGLDPDEHPEWHRFFADEYVAPPEVAGSIREKVLSRGWGFVEADGEGGLSLHAAAESEEGLRQALAALAEAERAERGPQP